jgi:hypothetical protein
MKIMEVSLLIARSTQNDNQNKKTHVTTVAGI